MGLDIYLAIDRKNLIATIDSLDSIEKELFEFKNMTGLEIDEYGKTILYIDHIRLLHELVDQPNEWSYIFQRAINLDSGLIIEGD